MAQPASPRISVVIPVYNGTNYLREAIESVFAQTYTDYEVIIVDDGSTDQTWSLIQSYGSRVRGIHKENGGISSALNCGIQQARGEYIAWLSHDDLFMPHKLERQIAMLTESPELGGCYSDYFEIDAQGKVVQEKRMPYYPPERVIRHLLQYMFINGCTVLMRQSCFEREGLFDENLRYAQDANMWFRLLRRFAFGHIPEFLVKYRIHPGQGSHKLKGRRADFHEFLRRCVEDYPLTDIFPELIGRETDNRTLARAHNCLGDSMRVCNHDYVLARAQYTQSLRYW
ncbi:MAG: glycosyltransferase, partial [Chloroflexi bacterium]|nr:glycosyltransferase [Chloroflexota bacterium]